MGKLAAPRSCASYSGDARCSAKAYDAAGFLHWEERQELRFEFNGSQPEAMTGGSLRHEAIGTTLRALLYVRLRGSACRAWGPNSKIEVQGRIRYPDAVVSCTPGQANDTILPAPVVVFEILSPTTSRTDRIEKLREHRATPSIQRYVILEQDSIAAMVFSRHDEEWTGHALTEVDVLRMPGIGIELPLADIYADADLGAAPPA
jgi:Uma2 family endonuclease